MHAVNEEGLIKGALLLVKSGDYHKSMNFTNFKDWLEEKFI